MIIEGRALDMTTDEALDLAAELIKAVRHAQKTGGAWFIKPAIACHPDGSRSEERIIFRITEDEV